MIQSTTLVGIASTIALIVPFIAYVLIKRKYSMAHGIWSAMVLTLIALAALNWMFDELQHMIIVAAVMMIVLGIISLQTKHALYFRLEPSIKGIATVLYILYFRIIGEQGVFQRMSQALTSSDESSKQSMDALAKSIAPEYITTIMHNIELHFMLWMIVVSAVMWYAAYKWNDSFWLVGKMLYVICAMILSVVSWMVLS